jgi:hypothetical protein
MISTPTGAAPPLSREEAGGLLGQTMGLVAVSAGVFALGAYIGRDTSGMGDPLVCRRFRRAAGNERRRAAVRAARD